LGRLVWLGLAFALMLTSPLAVAGKPAEMQQASHSMASSERDQTLARADELSEQATMLYQKGNYADALSLSAEALQLRREVLGERHPDTLQSFNNYAFILETLDRTIEAIPLHAKTLELSRAMLGERHPNTLGSLENLAYALLNTDQTQEALSLSRERVRIGRKRAIELAEDRLRGDVQRQRELGSRLWTERFHANALWSNFAPDPEHQSPVRAEAFTALQFASAGSTTQAIADAAALRFADSVGLQELVQERQALARRWAALEEALVKAQTGGEGSEARRSAVREQLQAAETRIDAIDERLEAEAPQYFAIRSPQAVDLDQLRAVLDEKEAVLFLVPTDRGTHAMAVTRETMAWQRSDIDEKALGDTVKAFRDSLEVQAGTASLPLFDLETAHGLYTDLIAPVETALAGKSRVYVVAEGALSRVPLGTLVAEPPRSELFTGDPTILRNTKWLADRYALIQLPSLQSLVYIRTFGADADAEDKASYAGFGAPLLGGVAQTRGARSAPLAAVDAAELVGAARANAGTPFMAPEALRRLAALPGTESELKLVQAALGADEDALFLAERMTEPALRRTDLSRIRILHLATHGFTSEEAGSLAEPGLVFTPPQRARPDDDGYLAASEVVGIDLTSAHWVILSACNTAAPSGNTGETGLSGLAQAFFYAGAESLLISHWPVFDDIAPLLTVETLRRSKAGRSRAEALQAAMRKIREDPKLDAAHPAVWAPFTLVGEGR